MRRDVAADLDHDLRVLREDERPRVAAAAPAADEQGHASTEREQVRRFEPPAPDTEDLTEREPPAGEHPDDAGRRLRPHRIAAAAASDADARRDDHDLALCKELDVHREPAA